jgi:hypothetical protein
MQADFVLLFVADEATCFQNSLAARLDLQEYQKLVWPKWARECQQLVELLRTNPAFAQRVRILDSSSNAHETESLATITAFLHGHPPSPAELTRQQRLAERALQYCTVQVRNRTNHDMERARWQLRKVYGKAARLKTFPCVNHYQTYLQHGASAMDLFGYLVPLLTFFFEESDNMDKEQWVTYLGVVNKGFSTAVVDVALSLLETRASWETKAAEHEISPHHEHYHTYELGSYTPDKAVQLLLNVAISFS